MVEVDLVYLAAAAVAWVATLAGVAAWASERAFKKGYDEAFGVWWDKDFRDSRCIWRNTTPLGELPHFETMCGETFDPLDFQHSLFGHCPHCGRRAAFSNYAEFNSCLSDVELQTVREKWYPDVR